MSVSPPILLVTLALGVPLMLLALGVLYHAYLFSRQPDDLLQDHVDGLATESTEDLLVALQEAVEDMQEQLSHQRDALAGMLSDARPVFATASMSLDPMTLDGPFEDGRPMAAGEYVPQPHVAQTHAATLEQTDLRGRIAELAEDGLSDRTIARELHIGLEEVRIARMRGRLS